MCINFIPFSMVQKSLIFKRVRAKRNTGSVRVAEPVLYGLIFEEIVDCVSVTFLQMAFVSKIEGEQAAFEVEVLFEVLL